LARKPKTYSDLPEKFEPGFLREFDQRTALFQRLNGIYQEIIEDVGGIASITHLKLAMIERFVFLEATLQRWEQDIAKNPDETALLVSRWVQAVNSLQGLAKTIGIERRARPAGDLRAYLEDGA
jgi:hypothetical protein